jgi:hypothetical protein
MFFTDQPGRVLAVTVVSPLLMYKGIQYNDNFIVSFAIILFLWDLYWILFSPPKESILFN